MICCRICFTIKLQLQVEGPLKIFCTAVHATGMVFHAFAEKMNSGYRCTFTPTLPGKYSVQAYWSPKKGPLMCDPLEILVYRNYSRQARNLLNKSIISLEGNGEKYWGISADKFSEIVSLKNMCQNTMHFPNFCFQYRFTSRTVVATML